MFMIMPLEPAESASGHFEIPALKARSIAVEEHRAADIPIPARVARIWSGGTAIPAVVGFARNQGKITIAFRISPRFIALYAAGNSDNSTKCETTSSARIVPPASIAAADLVSLGPHE